MEIAVRINRSEQVVNITNYSESIWQFILYTPQDDIFDFFDKINIGDKPRTCQVLAISDIYYHKRSRIEDLIPESFCQIGNIVYFMNTEYNPEWLYKDMLFMQLGYGLTT